MYSPFIQGSSSHKDLEEPRIESRTAPLNLHHFLKGKKTLQEFRVQVFLQPPCPTNMYVL